MAVYVVAYDVLGWGEEVSELEKRFRFWGAQRVLQSTWLIETARPAAAIRDDLKTYLGDSDRLFIAKLTGQTAWTKVFDEGAHWLRHRFNQS